MFELHPRLEADTHFLADLPLCRVLLMEDARFPWLILVPRIEAAREIHLLSPADRVRLMDEITAVSNALETVCAPDKLNIGALGNIVEQLHVHVVARRKGDAAWPGPVWGSGASAPYEQKARAILMEELKKALESAIVASVQTEVDGP